MFSFSPTIPAARSEEGLKRLKHQCSGLRSSWIWSGKRSSDVSKSRNIRLLWDRSDNRWWWWCLLM